MRTQFIECKNRRTAIAAMPWAAIIRKVEGGYHGWESIEDYKTWSNQK